MSQRDHRSESSTASTPHHSLAAVRERAKRASLANPYWLLEGLENRTLMAVSTGTVFDINSVPVYRATTADVRDLKNGPISALGSSLASVYLQYRSYARSGGDPADFVAKESGFLNIRGTSVGVQIRTRESLSSFTRTLRRYGLVVTGSNSAFSVVEGFLPINLLSDVSQLPGIAVINPVYRATYNAQGSIDNQQNQATNANGQTATTVRDTLGVTGNGVSVGVVSDSVNLFGNGLEGSVGSGDLPDDVAVIQDGDVNDATDEGRAILELINDVAPDADLLFATGSTGQLGMARNIDSLAQSGADVIVDDVRFVDEPFYQPGVIDQSINNFVSDGGFYVTAAGNNAGTTFDYAAQYYTDRKGSTYVDFDPTAGISGVAGTSPVMQVTLTKQDPFSFDPLTGLPLAEPFVIQWSDPYNGVVGQALTDFSVRLYDLQGNLLQVADENNFRSGRPLETLQITNSGTYLIQLAVNSVARRQSLPQRIGLLFEGGLISEFTDPSINTSGVTGHQANENAFVIGAVSFTNAPPVSGAGTAVSDPASGSGTITLLYNADGSPAVRTRQVPDFSAISNVNTSFFAFGNDSGDDIPEDPDRYGNFAGTSAAAGNAASVIALLIQANPAITREEIFDALRDNALDVNGTAGGTFDPSGGFGLINPYDSVVQVLQAPQADIENPTPIQYNALQEVIINFTHAIDPATLTAADFTLTRDGFNVPLTGAFVTPIDNGSTADNVSFVLTGLAPLTAEDGLYVLRLNASASGVTDLAPSPNLLDGDAVASFTKATLSRPTIPVSVTATALSSDTIRIRFTDNSGAGAASQSFIVRRADDVRFTKNVKTFTLTGSTTFTDRPLTSGRFYYYRVFAANDAGRSGSSEIAYAATLSPDEQILDNAGDDVQIDGNWFTRSDTATAFDGDYLTDLNRAKGLYSVVYTPTLTKSGDYFIYARWTKAADNATSVPYTITYGKSGTKPTTVYVNQRDTGGGGFVLLGKFNVARGIQPTVTISNAGTNGNVIADAIRFTPVS